MLTTAARAGTRVARLAIPALSAIMLMMSSTGTAQAAPHDRYFDVRKNFADERVVGATNVHIAGMEPISTPWTVGVKGTAIAPPDISFISSAAAAGAAPPQTSTVSKNPPPTCSVSDPITNANLNVCIDDFARHFDAFDVTIRTAAKDGKGILTVSRALVTEAPDLRDKQTYDGFKARVNHCIFGAHASSSVTCPTVPAGQNAADRSATIAAVDAADDAAVKATSDYNRVFTSQAYNASKDPAVKARLEAIKKALDDDKSTLEKLDKFRHDTLDPLTITQYFYEIDATCSGLFNSGREKQITMTFGTSDTRDVTIVCTTPLFVSLGFGQSGLSNRTFTAVAPNTAGQPAPAANATPAPSTIVENDRGTRAVVQTMLHLTLVPDDQGGGLAYSLGIGTPVFKGGGGTDLLTGLSYVYRRTAVVTAGIALGKSQQLANGYTAGGLIPASTTPPTLNHYPTSFYFGLSFTK